MLPHTTTTASVSASATMLKRIAGERLNGAPDEAVEGLEVPSQPPPRQEHIVNCHHAAIVATTTATASISATKDVTIACPHLSGGRHGCRRRKRQRRRRGSHQGERLVALVARFEHLEERREAREVREGQVSEAPDESFVAPVQLRIRLL